MGAESSRSSQAVVMRSCNASCVSMEWALRANEGRYHKAAPIKQSKHPIVIPTAQYQAVAQGMKSEMRNRKHTHIMLTIITYSVQLSICYIHNIISYGCMYYM